jgi:undecaprenyl diphosphate synthase
VKSVRSTVEQCLVHGIEVLTLFAFSSENWKRPEDEVSLLMDLVMMALNREVKRLHKNSVCLKIIGERSAFSQKLQDKIAAAENLTASNDALILQIAANYGGRWDLTDATRKIAQKAASGQISPEQITEEMISSELSFAKLPDPDLFIRTGGEARLSNFMLWQTAYSELYFTDTYWPDFDPDSFQSALDYYAGRQRRFGKTGEQVSTGS